MFLFPVTIVLFFSALSKKVFKLSFFWILFELTSKNISIHHIIGWHIIIFRCSSSSSSSCCCCCCCCNTSSITSVLSLESDWDLESSGIHDTSEYAGRSYQYIFWLDSIHPSIFKSSFPLHFLDKIPYASSWVFLFSGPFVKVLLSSTLKMISSSLWRDSPGAYPLAEIPAT